MIEKDRMLNHITNNVNWFLSTDSSTEVIPYYNMSSSVFSRAKEYIASEDVDFDVVVCLISTSIWEQGKSGILFTTTDMYCKSWGLFTTKYSNAYYNYENATFDFHNDFHENRMKELMKDLSEIYAEEWMCALREFEASQLESADNQIEQSIGGVVNEFVDVTQGVLNTAEGVVNSATDFVNALDDAADFMKKLFSDW